ncbi:hypothetical protein N5T98_10750 [Aliarcobacter cryaerophilus]|uniref:glycosyltransferase n=1 Tax=Aliarcobacter cryaerophilus TaxID=28198 RepID=UPI0021B66677|nr:glycosyltransferase [Aliarcobacter cryaerophilus]MCT7487109.1 hypothetical protein [Aliarcobacter cryaerophilus]MCT7491577.1 hypothetical protein [Aliarcobacter cryaerophilus]
MKLYKKIFLGLIERLLLRKKLIVFNKSGKKNALVSYVLIPPFNLDSYFMSSHNNRLACKYIIDVLVEKGYKVYLYNYFDKDVDYSVNYDIFIGHNVTFYEIANKMNISCEKILLLTGSNPAFDNKQLERRNEYLHKRHRVKLPYKPLSDEHVIPNFEVAKKILVMGNDFVTRTWPQNYSKKYRIYNNILKNPVRKKSTRTNVFIFMASIVMLRRGLDLLLDVFSKRTEKIYICGPFEKEKEFMDIYSSIIDKSDNIISLGYVDTNSKEFYDVVTESTFAILPSCSEGQSSIVIDFMALGLVPIIMENSGFENIDEIGYKITDDSVEGINSIVDIALSATDDEIDKKRDAIVKYLDIFKEDAFKENFQTIIEKKI